MLLIRPQLDRRLRPDPLVSPANASAQLYGSVEPTETKGLRSRMVNCTRAGDYSSSLSARLCLLLGTAAHRCQGKGKTRPQHGVNSPNLHMFVIRGTLRQR